MLRNASKLLLAALLVAAVGCTEKATLGGGGTKPPTPVNPDPDPDPSVDETDLIHFPAGQDPLRVGNGATELFLASGNSNWGDMHASTKSTLTSYPDVCAWLGAFWYAEASGNDALFNRLVAKFDQFLTVDDKNTEPNKSLVTQIPRTEGNAVDYNIFGAVPLHIYAELKRRGRAESEIAKYLELGLPYADQQWELPTDEKYLKNFPNARKYHDQGYSYQTRLWIDDMFMITALQSQAYLATGDEKYIERAAREMMLYLDELPGANSVFYHAPSAKFFWGRGNGWMAVGMPEMLRMLPARAEYDSYRDRILAKYKAMMATLSAYQYESGMWGQLINYNTADMWEETSGSAMFTYAMIVGVKRGWLKAGEYGPVARKGWLGLVASIDENDEVRDVCEGTNIKNDRNHYMNRQRITGDLHAHAPLLWCAAELCTEE